MNLFQYETAMMDCVNQETGEVDIDKLNSLQMERTAKIENLVLWSKEKRAYIEALKNEAVNLNERIASAEKDAERLESYIGDVLNHEKFVTPKCEVKFTKSTYVKCDDEKAWVKNAVDAGDMEFITTTEKVTVTQKLDKNGIKAYLADPNNHIDGITVETRYSLKAK